MPEYRKPVPVPDPDSKIYWEGCKRRELLVQRCEDCGQYQFYPRLLCTKCMSDNMEWVRAKGAGEIYSFTIVHRAPSEAFAEDTPYIVAMVELDEGVRMMSNVVECRPEDAKIGLKVKVVFEEITDEITLPKFKPIPSDEGG